MPTLIVRLANVVFCWSVCSYAQELPSITEHSSPARQIVSVDGTTRSVADKWFSDHKQPELGIIASPAGGWLNWGRPYDVDCEFAFQWLDIDSFVAAKGIHDWLKFPSWSRMSVARADLSGVAVFDVSRLDFPHDTTDHIYVIEDERDRIAVIRLITFNRLDTEQRANLVRSIFGLIGGSFRRTHDRSETIGNSIGAWMFVNTRDAPTSLSGAVQELIDTITPAEREHLLESMDDESDLLDGWPTIEGKVNRLHWMLVYWGLNDPSSPLRRDIGLPDGSPNAEFILAVLRSVEKRIRENARE